MDENTESYTDRVEQDHYLHLAATLFVAFWAGSTFHWWTGLVVFLIVKLGIAMTNILVLAKTGSFKAVRFNRWAWVAGTLVVMLIMSAEFVSG